MKWLIVGLVLVLGVVGFAAWSIVPTLGEEASMAPTRILAADGSLLYEVNANDQTMAAPVALTSMPLSLLQAVIAAEDKRFFEHAGVDPIAIVRSVRDNFRANDVVSGGSTIEMQLIKNTFFPAAPRTMLQKIREATAAWYWSLTHTKAETLERYLNTVYLGNNLFGVQTAAQEYFHKDVADLSEAEAVYLAGMIASPARYEPLTHRSAGFTRQEYVLSLMESNGFVTTDEARAIAETPISFFAPRHELRAPHFVFRVLAELESSYPDIATGGYEITTTLDPNLQSVAEETVDRRLADLREEHVTNASVVAVDPTTGDVLAYVGSAGYWSADDGAVNMATALRQPGSALKPFMYHAALMEKLVTPGTIVPDLPVRYDITQEGEEGSYVPRNYNYQSNGPVTVRDALGSSLNIPAVHVLNELGLYTFFGTLERFGITFPNPPEHYGLGIVLGGGEVTLEETTRAYAALSAGNQLIELRLVRSVSQDGRVLETFDTQAEPIFSPHEEIAAEQATALITDILSDPTARSLSFGETSLMEIGEPVVVKTGTTKDFRDNWAFGYTSDFVLGVWVGNADNSTMYGVSGVSGAVPIWHDVMAYRYRDRDALAFAWPAGIVDRDICTTSGLLATPLCPKRRLEHFIVGTEPTSADDWYRAVQIDLATGAVATSACGAETVTQIFLVPPPEYRLWVDREGIDQPPGEDCEGNSSPYASSDRQTIVSPLDGETIRIHPHVALEAQRVPFVAGASCGGACRWRLNGEEIVTPDETYLWESSPGAYTLTLDGADGQVQFVVE